MLLPVNDENDEKTGFSTVGTNRLRTHEPQSANSNEQKEALLARCAVKCATSGCGRGGDR
jgi:hypothetical protein